jgi:hypothetical protein
MEDGRLRGGLRAEMQRNFDNFVKFRGILMISGAQLRRNFGQPAAPLRRSSNRRQAKSLTFCRWDFQG